MRKTNRLTTCHKRLASRNCFGSHKLQEMLESSALHPLAAELVGDPTLQRQREDCHSDFLFDCRMVRFGADKSSHSKEPGWNRRLFKFQPDKSNFVLSLSLAHPRGRRPCEPDATVQMVEGWEIRAGLFCPGGRGNQGGCANLRPGRGGYQFTMTWWPSQTITRRVTFPLVANPGHHSLPLRRISSRSW